MKTTSVLTFVTLMFASCMIDRATANNCTKAQITEFGPVVVEYSNNKDCSVTTSDKCPTDKCMVTLQKISNKMPDCEYEGQNARIAFYNMFKQCNISSASSTFTLSASVVAASTAIAVAVTFL